MEENKEVKLKKKIVLRQKKDIAAFTFNGLLKVKCSWEEGGVSSDLDLCLFFRRKDGQVGGVFAKEYRQKKSDEGCLSEFPFMLHKGDVKSSPDSPLAEEQINIASLNGIDTAYVCVLAYDAALNGEEVSFAGCNGKVELMSDSGDYLEVPIDTDKSGHLYLICTIKNENGINSVMNEGNIMDLSTAYNKIPAFSFICEE